MTNGSLAENLVISGKTRLLNEVPKLYGENEDNDDRGSDYHNATTMMTIIVTNGNGIKNIQMKREALTSNDRRRQELHFSPLIAIQRDAFSGHNPKWGRGFSLDNSD